MAVTANQLTPKKGSEHGSGKVAAAVHLYQGTLAFWDDGVGALVAVVDSGANPFAGVVIEEKDNSAGLIGDEVAELETEGDFPLPGTGFTQATVGQDIYASDNYTVTTSGSSTTYIGQCVEYISSTLIRVRIRARGPASALAGAATGTTAATFVVDTDLGKPRVGLKSQTGGTGDFVAYIQAPATLTADHTFTLPADSDQTLVGATATQTLTNKTLTSPTMTAPVLGIATGTSLAVTAGLTSSGPTGAGIGYATGAGGAVTQLTSITTGVTLNTLAGQITTVSSTLGAGVDASFTVTNSTVAAGDVIVINTKSYGGTADGIPICKVQSVGAGSFVVNVHNQGAVSLDAVIVMSFAVIKSVAS